MFAKKALILFLFVLVFSLASDGQSRIDLQTYMNHAGENALLFRGRIDKKYNFKYQGTYFAYSEEFIKGDIFFNGKLYHDILLNLNSNRDELNIKQSPAKYSIVLDGNLTEYFILDGRKFINIQGQSVPDGYYEVVYDGKSTLLKKIVKLYKEELVSSGSAQASLLKIFSENIRYYIKKGSEFYNVKGKKSFVDCFKENKKDINRVYGSTSSSDKKDKDTFYRKVISEGCNQ